MLRRKAYDILMEWKGRVHKPLLVKGQKQIGKTFTIEAFARANYPHFVRVDFSCNAEAGAVFSEGLCVDSIIKGLESLYPDAVFEPGSTLIFFDGVQDCLYAYSSLKYFALDGRYDVIAAVSFLEIALRRNDEIPGPSVPVGYTEHLTMHPLDFEEFLWAKGVGDDTIAMLRSYIHDRAPIPEDMHPFLDSCFREFMVVGGMPEAVREYMDSGRMDRVVGIQERLWGGIESDIRRYSTPYEAVKTMGCLNSIPERLGQSDGDFMQGDPGKTWRYLENLAWIRDSGIGNFCHRVSPRGASLFANEERCHFRIYLFDTGLMVSRFRDSVRKAVATGERCTGLGVIVENVVAECMVKCGITPRYYNKNKGDNRMEPDFVVKIGRDLAVMEVKSGKDREAPSLSK
ncbi:MAG: ATP-binding protein, partial [Candidatus Methanomethylophilaceae archaeon]